MISMSAHKGYRTGQPAGDYDYNDDDVEQEEELADNDFNGDGGAAGTTIAMLPLATVVEIMCLFSTRLCCYDGR